jgi:hypothetical protein
MKAEAQALKGHLDTLLRQLVGRRWTAPPHVPAHRRRLHAYRGAWREFAAAVTGARPSGCW